MYGKIALGVLALGAVVLMGIPIADQNMYWYEIGYTLRGYNTTSNGAMKRGLWTHHTIQGTEDTKGPLLGNSDKSLCNDDATDNVGDNCCDHFRETQVSVWVYKLK